MKKLAVFVLLIACVRAAAQNDYQPIKQSDIVAQCMVWESRYGTEDVLPVELFTDLQRYVVEGKYVEALSDYRQNELICTVEELAEACPDYETLVEEYFADQWGENLLQTEKIYHLQKADGEDCFLLFYVNFAGSDDKGYLSTMTLKKDGQEWRLTGNTSKAGGVRDYEIFAREEAGEKFFYLLKLYDSSSWLELSRLSESFHVPLGGWDIGLIETGVKPEILFQEANSALVAQVKEYVEENACFLAWMQENHKPIWGDEGKEEHYVMREAVSPDADGTEQIWVIDFEKTNSKETVIFQMTEGEDGLHLLEARDGDLDGRLVFSCKLNLIKEAGVRGITPAYWETFDCSGLTAGKQKNLPWSEMWEQVLQEQQNRSITPWQGEKEFSDAVFHLLREEAWTGLCGEPNMLLESYRVDLTEDTESFMQMVQETMGNRTFVHREDEECKWAYRWGGEDGSDNFLSCINYGFAKDSIQWWKVTDGSLEEYAYVMESYDSPQIISCEGQVYCITEAVPAYWGGEVSTSIIKIDNGETWRTAHFSISTSEYYLRGSGSGSGLTREEEQDFTCIPLYEAGGLPLVVKDYVQERYEEAARACMNWKIYVSDMEEGQGLTAEANRMLNSLSDGSRDLYANRYYFAADIDNDGIVEYGAAEDGGGLAVTFYEAEKGAFYCIPFEEMFPRQDDFADLPEEALILRQLWCEKLGDTTYLFTVEGVSYSPDFLLRIRVLKDNYVEEKAVYLLKVSMAEDYRERDLEITPSAEGVG